MTRYNVMIQDTADEFAPAERSIVIHANDASDVANLVAEFFGADTAIVAFEASIDQ